jgi:hypothetical protein
MRQFSIGEVVT